MQIIEDKYQGILITNYCFTLSLEDFQLQIASILQQYCHKKLAWISIPISASHYIPILTQLNFVFHSCTESSITLVSKFHDASIIPTTKNYIVGVGAIVIHEQSLLVIQDVYSSEYKLPGGHINPSEMIEEAVIREIYEETGITVCFDSIVNIGHFMQGQFGESNLFIVCNAIAQNTTIQIQDTAEIQNAIWMPIHEFLTSVNVNNYNKHVVQATIENGTHRKLTKQQIPLRVSRAEVFF